MWQSDPALDKYGVTQSGYFRPVTTVALSMGVKYGNLLLYHEISEEIKDKTI